MSRIIEECANFVTICFNSVQDFVDSKQEWSLNKSVTLKQTKSQMVSAKTYITQCQRELPEAIMPRSLPQGLH